LEKIFLIDMVDVQQVRCRLDGTQVDRRIQGCSGYQQEIKEVNDSGKIDKVAEDLERARVVANPKVEREPIVQTTVEFVSSSTPKRGWPMGKKRK